MRIVYQRCCGMDVHKDSVTACVLLIDEYGEWRSEKRKFRTMTRDLREMLAWLASLDVVLAQAEQDQAVGFEQGRIGNHDVPPLVVKLAQFSKRLFVVLVFWIDGCIQRPRIR